MNHLPFFQLLPNHQINRNLYHDCVINSKQHNIYGMAWYLDLVTPYWSAIIYGDSESYQAVMPLPISIKMGYAYVKYPLFCQQLGVYHRQHIREDIEKYFIEFLYKNIKYVGKYFFNIKNHITCDLPHIRITLNHTHCLDLSKPYHEIHQNYNRNRKINLKQAMRTDQCMVQSQDIEPMIRIFKENTAYKIQGGVANSAYILLRNIYQELKSRGLVELFYTKEKNTITSGAMVINYHHQLIYIFNAGDETFKKSNGRTLIVDSIIKRYAETNYVFDFESPNIPRVSKFYQSFGATPMAFHRIHYNRLPPWMRGLQTAKKNLIDIQKKISIRLP